MIIEIQGKKYDLNMEAAILKGLMKLVYTPKSIGNYFRYYIVENAQAYCILVSAGDMGVRAVRLVDIITGLAISPVVQVQDLYKLTQEEWLRVCSGEPSDYTPVTLKLTQVLEKAE